MTRHPQMPIAPETVGKRVAKFIEDEQREGVKRQRTLRIEVTLDELDRIAGVYFIPPPPEKVRLA